MALDAPWFVQYGIAGALAVFFTLLVLRGYLQPQSTVKSIREDHAELVRVVREDRDTRVAEIAEVAKTWRDAYETERTARQVGLEAVDRVIEVSELTLDIVKAWDQALTQKAGERGE